MAGEPMFFSFGPQLQRSGSSLPEKYHRNIYTLYNLSFIIKTLRISQLLPPSNLNYRTVTELMGYGFDNFIRKIRSQ